MTKRFAVSALIWVVFLFASGFTNAGAITATYSAAGVTTPTSSVCGATAGCSVGYESFNYVTAGQASSGFTSNFSGGSGTASAYTGVYSPFTLNSADQYGGAGGTGNYAVVFGGNAPPSYSLTLTNTNTGGGVNYFGIWISALDANNQIQFYDANNTLIYTFTAQQLVTDLGSCNGGHAANAYCGNPSSGYYVDGGEQFAYVNFFDTVGTFSKIVFTEINGTGAGFESDNQAVAFNPNLTISGTAIPEPSSGLLLLAGISWVWLIRRRAAIS